MRRSLTATAIAALVVSALVACTPQPPDRATTTVGADGFELALDGVTATGTGGVAPEGTQVTLELVGQATGGGLAATVTELGKSISLTLGDGLQPAKPVDLRFEIHEPAISGEEWSSDQTLLILTESEDGTVGLLETARDGDVLAATTDHLSLFQPIQMDFGKALSQARDFVMQSLGIEMPAPVCVGETVTIASTFEYRIDDRGWVHPCISLDGDTITVNLYAASVMPYRVVSTPQVTGTTVASPDGQGILTELVNRWIPTPSGGVAMGGGASAQFSFSSSDPPQYFEARQDAGMVIGAVLLNLIGIIINPLGGGAAFMEKVGQLDCLSGVVSVAAADTFNASTAAEFLRITLACVGTAAAAASYPIRLALGLIGAIPALFAGSFIGLFNEITGQGTVRVDVIRNVIPWVITADGIGPLKVGSTTWDDVSSLPGFTGDTGRWESGCAAGGWFGEGTIYDGMSVLTHDMNLPSPGSSDLNSISLGSYYRTGIAATVPAATLEGIKLGSSQADVEGAYPAVLPRAHRLDMGLLLYEVENGAGRGMSIGVRDGVVINITVGDVPTIYAPEGCA